MSVAEGGPGSALGLPVGGAEDKPRSWVAWEEEVLWTCRDVSMAPKSWPSTPFPRALARCLLLLSVASVACAKNVGSERQAKFKSALVCLGIERPLVIHPKTGVTTHVTRLLG